MPPIRSTEPVSSAAEEAASAASPFGALPVWNLADLYPGPDSPELEADMDAAAKEAKAFRAAFEGKLAALVSGADAGDALGKAIGEYEAIEERLGRIASYASLLYATNTTDPAIGKVYGGVQERLTGINADLLFFTLELNRLDDAAIANATSKGAAAAYAPWLRLVRRWRPHDLDQDTERLFLDKDLPARAAWVRLYDETLAGLSFDLDGQQMPLEAALSRLSEPARADRQKAAEALVEGFKPNIRLFTHILNVLTKDKSIGDSWRGYKDPADARHLGNDVEAQTVGALVKSVRDAYASLAHRYYGMKAGWLGLDKLDYWDRNAPPPFASDIRFSWSEAREIVLGAYGQFSPRMADEARRFFDHGWIHAPVAPGKMGGAFAHPSVPSVHPYVLVNYQGRPRDVTTLAHELGHGVHQLLAGRQGLLMAQTPLTLAETASVFGEMLTFRTLLDKATSDEERRALLASKVEDMLNTVVRQIAFFTFEEKVHAARAEGELDADQIGRIWLEVQRESLGPAFDFADGYETYWCYVSHFFHAPFYVYAYAFGDCLVNSLYALYEAEGEAFVPRYFDMLSAGGTLHHSDLLAPFELDARDPAFWQKGLGLLARFIDELEGQDGA